MRTKRTIFFILLLFVVFVCPKSVYADGLITDVQYHTTIENWAVDYNRLAVRQKTINPNYSLLFTLTDGVTTVDLTNDLTTSNTVGDLVFLSECGGVEGFAEGSNLTFTEKVYFQSVDSPLLGIHSLQYEPSIIETDTNYNMTIKSAFFQYNDIPDTVYYLLLNQTDGVGNVTGSPYIHRVYLENDLGEKINDYSLGTVKPPRFMILYNYYVRGNMAEEGESFYGEYPSNTYPDFQVEHEGFTSSTFHYDYVEDVSVLEDFYADSTASSYINYNHDSNYDISLEEKSGGNSFESALQYDDERDCFLLEYNVEARYDLSGADTGIWYSIIPYIGIIGILLLGIGLYLFINKKKKTNEE